MAKVTLTVEDKPDGTVNIVAESDPPFRVKHPKENTDAQMIVLGWISDSTEDAEEIHSIRFGD